MLLKRPSEKLKHILAVTNLNFLGLFEDTIKIIFMTFYRNNYQLSPMGDIQRDSRFISPIVITICYL